MLYKLGSEPCVNMLERRATRLHGTGSLALATANRRCYCYISSNGYQTSGSEEKKSNCRSKGRDVIKIYDIVISQAVNVSTDSNRLLPFENE